MKHHILAIGISKHQHSFVNNLSYAAKDASDFYNLFVANIGDIGYKKLLLDSEAALSQVRTALGSELREAMQSEDAFFFFYSGHGATAESNDNQSLAHYLLPFDATRDIQSSCISVPYLKEIFDALSTNKNFIFIDSCFSGSINLSKGYSNPSKKAYKEVKTFTNTVSGNGRMIFTACKEDEEAIEDPENKNGLFSYFLLEELQRRTSEFSVADMITPVMESVTKRARENFQHTQTPTLQTYLEGGVYLPPFKKRISIAPQTIDVPKYPQLAQASFQIPEIQLEDKKQEKIINEMVNLILNRREIPDQELHNVILEKFCQKVFSHLKMEWETIFVETGSDVSKIPVAVAKLEGAAFQFILLGGIVAVFGSEKQMQIYSSYVTEILEWTQRRSGLTALVATPEVIVIEIIYIVGVLSLAKNRLKPFQTLLESEVEIFEEWDQPYEPLLFHLRDIHFCEALGGAADKVNDHVREILNSFGWLSELVPRLKEKTTDYQLQINFLIVMLSIKYKIHLWHDFARWDRAHLWPLVQKIRYNANFGNQLEELFHEKEGTIRQALFQLLEQDRKTAKGRWHSIGPEDLLTKQERESGHFEEKN